MKHARFGRLFDSVGWFLVFVLLAFVFRPEMVSAATRVMTDGDKGGSVHIKTGEALEVRLKSNPSTGYMWYVQSGSTPLLRLVHESQTEPAKPGVGRPVFQVFRFEAKRPGEGVLLMHYVRSWEKPAADDEQFQIHVVVQ